MKIYYKIVRVLGKRYYPITEFGYILARSVAPDGYQTGTWIKARPGGFFAFNTKAAAEDFRRSRAQNDCSWKIVPCQLRGIIKIPVAVNTVFNYTRRVKKNWGREAEQLEMIWNCPSDPKVSLPVFWSFPTGTVCARGMRLLSEG